MLEGIAERLRWPPGPQMLDIGGSYGCLGFELAAKGWKIAVADIDPSKTEQRGPWLQWRLPQQAADGVQFWTIGMEEIAKSRLLERRWHTITFFLSLCNVRERHRIPPILRACWRRIVPGGALLVHEYVPEGIRVDGPQGLQFDREELVRLISENAAPPEHLYVSDGSSSDKFTGTLLAVKNGGAAQPVE